MKQPVAGGGSAPSPRSGRRDHTGRAACRCHRFAWNASRRPLHPVDPSGARRRARVQYLMPALTDHGLAAPRDCAEDLRRARSRDLSGAALAAEQRAREGPLLATGRGQGRVRAERGTPATGEVGQSRTIADMRSTRQDDMSRATKAPRHQSAAAHADLEARLLRLLSAAPNGLTGDSLRDDLASRYTRDEVGHGLKRLQAMGLADRGEQVGHAYVWRLTVGESRVA